MQPTITQLTTASSPLSHRKCEHQSDFYTRYFLVPRLGGGPVLPLSWTCGLQTNTSENTSSGFSLMHPCFFWCARGIGSHQITRKTHFIFHCSNMSPTQAVSEVCFSGCLPRVQSAPFQPESICALYRGRNSPVTTAGCPNDYLFTYLYIYTIGSSTHSHSRRLKPRFGFCNKRGKVCPAQTITFLGLSLDSVSFTAHR